jgi:MurNAc alpha-1-phosphate uridylyltransferase
MRSYEANVPKSLLPVAGHPFIHWQLSWLSAQGVESVVLSVGHMGAMIRDYVQDGAAWSVAVRYVEELGGLRGTGGAVRLAVDEKAVGDEFFVLYGDSYLDVDMAAVHGQFVASGLPALMTVFANDGKWDTSNVVSDGNKVTRYDKHCSSPPPDMRFIDYGLSAVRTKVVQELIPSDVTHDLADFFMALSQQGRLGAFTVQNRFYEVGSPKGLRELERHLGDGSRN